MSTLFSQWKQLPLFQGRAIQKLYELKVLLSLDVEISSSSNKMVCINNNFQSADNILTRQADDKTRFLCPFVKTSQILSRTSAIDFSVNKPMSGFPTFQMLLPSIHFAHANDAFTCDAH